MNREKITTSTITLGDVKLTGYKTSDGSWFMSLTGLGKVVGKGDDSPRKWIKSKWLETRLGKSFKPFEVTGNDNRTISVIPIEVVKLYFRRQDKLGNPIAEELIDALVDVSLYTRLEAELNNSRTTKEILQELARVGKRVS